MTAEAKSTAKSSRERVAVVIVTYNSSAVLPGLLDSLDASLEGVAEFEVFVVDNQSKDASADIAAAHPVGVKVVRMGGNVGYAAAINAAAHLAGPDAHLLILNPDLRLKKGSVRPLLDQLRSETAGIAVPCNFKEDGSVDPTIRREPSVLTAWCDGVLGGRLASRLRLGEIVDSEDTYERPGPVDWATGSAILISPRARRAVGDWDETYFLYGEEVDYQRRLRQAGLSVVYVPQSHVMHIGGEYRVNPRLYALLTTNRIRYFRRYHGLLPTLLFRLGVVVGEGLRFWRGPPNRSALLHALLPLKPAFHFRKD
jgi:GT2 family glycosyltransferase